MANISLLLFQVKAYYTNARRHPGYKKMCEEQGIVPVQRKKKAKSSTSDEGEKENQPPVCGKSDSSLGSDGLKPASARSSGSPPQIETSSPEIEASPEQVFVVDAGIDPHHSHPHKVTAFKEGLGFFPC
ncbi:hypothetical protein JTE90_000672 [Oedothorax gibbosus]|uniref:Uncharacterized protein n=1 Tax=Oedothorax gibbosus TaxID=931172 RepID=A0AAV6VY05_9ARAC|nr:hypothetical protein JTE90_000672 [Oedothorax gibbosus]